MDENIIRKTFIKKREDSKENCIFKANYTSLFKEDEMKLRRQYHKLLKERFKEALEDKDLNKYGFCFLTGYINLLVSNFCGEISVYLYKDDNFGFIEVNTLALGFDDELLEYIGMIGGQFVVTASEAFGKVKIILAAPIEPEKPIIFHDEELNFTINEKELKENMIKNFVDADKRLIKYLSDLFSEDFESNNDNKDM